VPFILQPPDHAFAIRSVRDDAIVVNDRVLTASFYLSPDALHEGWPPPDLAHLRSEDLAGPLALEPEVVLLGTGTLQRFPPAAILATCLTRGIGIEVMANAAAARTFSVLANEGRRVVAAFLLG
jgi:uncharacterized protein